MHPSRTILANVLGILVIFGFMAILAVAARTDMAAFGTEACDSALQCDISGGHVAVDADRTPTPAPPRIGSQPISDNSILMLSGQPVFVQVKVDQPEIEVSWAPGDLMGR
jgi:hypothetical protein